MSTDKISVLLNWHATPYHLPILLPNLEVSYFAKEGIKVAILEPNDPSDVTELIGTGKADLGCKAMIHTLAGKARGFPIKSIGTLMDEPFTGVIYLEGSGITSDFKSLKGKRIGYVGEFGKIQIDELTKYYGMTSDDYTAVRCGMNVSKAIIEGTIDAASDVKMLRIDELAELGCCCFCSILYIVNWLAAHPKEASAFMRAVKAGADDMFADPRGSWLEYCKFKPPMNTPLNRLMFERSFNYMSKDLANVARDWNKVTNYSKRLGIVPTDFVSNYTNEFVQWEVADEGGEAEAYVAIHGGVLQAVSA
ncbi:protein NMT1 [Phakopsora pachyrhizi]|uniref:4-amino-5-hydroxymethyl-2-methylpyrimidine phosphate synthase n=1 Tax=Phakopsora pachyrhizi TaxID=170000 RepID=A0AAV0BD65_PHAPC|nr:protein NMT1 [Phakopsora pachyrhizi]